MRKLREMTWVLPLALSALVLAACEDTSGSKDSGPKDQSDAAAVMCENFVEKHLDAPATADFPRSEQEAWKIKGEEHRYNATGVVDAENQFGAKLRSRYVCDLKTDADGEEWQLLNQGDVLME